MAELEFDSLERELKILAPESAAIVALRAAMRVLPVLARRLAGDDSAFGFWKAHERAGHMLAIFRCYQVSLLGASLPRSETTAAGVLYSDAANAVADAADAAHAVVAYAALDAARDAAASSAAHAAAAARDAAASAARDAAAAAYAAEAASAAALEHDLATLEGGADAVDLLEPPLWPQGVPIEIDELWKTLQMDLRALDAGFEIWIDWYEERLQGRALDLEVEKRWARLSDSRLAQSAAEINAHLKSLLKGEATQPLNRVRAIFIGHGGVGKTSLIRALHGEQVVEGREAMTPGLAIKDSILDMDEKAGVFTEEHQLDDSDLTVHFWDFGGQVMAHATHQFFLREQCLYIIVLNAREERNANEEAEYWLEHVRAFGRNAAVMLVGNKSDQAQVNLDLRTLKKKYTNVIDFYPLSCTQARGRFRAEFERFDRDFKEQLTQLGTHAELFTRPQFTVLKAVQSKALKDDFLPHRAFDEICADHQIAPEGPGGRESLLDLFDKLGIVMHFPQLPYFEDFVLNPRWLTYGVYSIIYSQKARAAKGRISDHDVVEILKPLSLIQPDGRRLRFPAERCRLIVDAMVAFRVAYRLAHDQQRLVIPALLEPEQPAHDFAAETALAFQFDFKGFLPRHVLPTLIVDHHADIAWHKETGEEIVWQNGVFLRPGSRYDAEALIRADYHERNLDIFVLGSDANSYLGLIRDSVLRTLKTMPRLPFEEKVRLRPDMRVDAHGMEGLGERPVWMAYDIIRTTERAGRPDFAGPDGHFYELEKVLRVMPLRPEARPADIVISYRHHETDRAMVDKLAADLERSGYSVWFDREMIGGQPFRDVIDQRIDAAKAVIALWTENSVGAKWVRAEASQADGQGKLVCLRAPGLSPDRLPLPFAANDHVLEIGDRDGLVKALDRLEVRPSRP